MILTKALLKPKEDLNGPPVGAWTWGTTQELFDIRSRISTQPLQRREYVLAPQPRESRRTLVPVTDPCRSVAPHLYSQQTFRAWERGRNGQQHRGARVALPFRHRRRSDWGNHSDFPHAGFLPVVRRSEPEPCCAGGDLRGSDAGGNLLR